MHSNKKAPPEILLSERKMKRNVQAAIFAIAALLSESVLPVEISAGTSEYITMRTCTVIGASGCDQISPVQFGQFGGLPGDSESTVNLSVDGYGSGSSSVALSGVIGAPILKASASSQSGKRISTNSIALQRYTYDGDTSTTRTFGGDIVYSQFSSGTYPAGIGSGINANIEIFTLPTETISIRPTAAANFNMLSSGYANLTGYSSLGYANFQDETSNAAGTGHLSVTVQLNPGDVIWVWALLQTPATNGGWIDSSHTFVTSWDETSNLTPSVVAVPEPGSLAMLILGVIFLITVVKTRQQNSIADA